VVDDGVGDQGSIASWTITITTVVTGPQPPTISDIPDQSTTTGSSTLPITFTVNDPDTTVASLTLSGASSNTGLVPNGNIVFGGSGSSRTVTVTPAAGQTGNSTITVTVSDGALTASDTFVLTVSGPNTPPTISDITDQTANEDTPTAALAFTVGDSQTAAGSLAVSGDSSNPALVPNGNIVFGGTGAARTVTVTPALNQSGTATITVTVSDGSLTAADSFLLTVNPVNDPPTISTIADQGTAVGVAVGPISFTVADVETAAGSLTVSGNSSNPTLVPNANLTFGGSGANRTLTVTPVPGQTGSATITVSVTDGTATANASFQLTVSPADAASPPGFVLETHSATDGAGAAFNKSVLPVNVTGVNPLLLAAWHAEFDGGLPDGWRVEYAGVPGTLIVDTNGYSGGDGNRRFRIYYWANPTPGLNSLIVSNNTTIANELAVSAILLTNAAQINPLGDVAVDASTHLRSAESETVNAVASDLIVHVIADRLIVRGALGPGETSRSVANDGAHPADGDASLWI
jgi:VCBS repeat-containing protein